MKILHMAPPDINNGVYRYLFNYIPYIDQNKYQFAFLTRAADALKETEEYKRFRFPVYCFEHKQRENKMALEQEIRNILQGGFDAVHLHTSSWRGFLIEEIAMDMGVGKVIVHSHSTGIDVWDDSERKCQALEHNAYKEKFSMQYATDVCACSRLAGEWLFGKQIPREEIRILPNAIDVERYRFQLSVRQKKRRELGMEGKVVVGCVGRYSYQKNQEFLIKVFAGAYKKRKEMLLLLIGQGETLPRLKKLAEDLEVGDAVLFLGWREDVEEYLQAMDIFCLPSRFEGFAFSLVEAQAAGLRCLVADTVSTEVALTDLVAFLPLEERLWQDALESRRESVPREQFAGQIEEKGYGIRTAAKKLTDLYDGKE